MAYSFKTRLEDARPPFVLGLDVGSTASRGGIYDATGTPVSGFKHRVAHAFTVDETGTSTIDADQVVAECAEIIDVCAREELGHPIAGVAMDTFASSLVGVDANGNAITPCYTYADSRCAAEVTHLREVFDEAEVQQRTGTRFHSSYLLPRFVWLRQADPELFAKVDRWMALGEYVYFKLLGHTAIGTSSAAWTGLLNRRTGEWDAELCAYAGVRIEQLGEIRDTDQPLTPLDDRIASRWPLLADAQWFAVITDGVASNIGAGAPDSSTIAGSAATSGAMRVVLHSIPETIPSGLWCYRVDRNRSILGGAINDVGRAISWLEETVSLPEDVDLPELMRAAPKSTTPLVLPYFTGERSTGWAAGAQAIVVGLTGASHGEALYRGTLEGVAYTYRRVFDQLVEAAGGVIPGQIRMSGRVTQDIPEWMAVLADSLGVNVLPVTIKRATLHGTIVLALETLAPGSELRDVCLGTEFVPVPEHAEHYARSAQRFEATYAALID